MFKYLPRALMSFLYSLPKMQRLCGVSPTHPPMSSLVAATPSVICTHLAHASACLQVPSASLYNAWNSSTTKLLFACAGFSLYWKCLKSSHISIMVLCRTYYILLRVQYVFSRITYHKAIIRQIPLANR